MKTIETPKAPDMGAYLVAKKKEIEDALIRRHGPERTEKLLAAVREVADRAHRYGIPSQPSHAQNDHARSESAWLRWHVKELIDEHLEARQGTHDDDDEVHA